MKTRPHTTRPRPRRPKISLLVPVYNGVGALDELLLAIAKACDPQEIEWELIYVDDGSRDDSVSAIKRQMARDPRVRFIGLSRNFGQQAALTAGLTYCRGAAVLILDQDLQDPPSLIPEFIARWREGYDVVYGVRKKRKEAAWLRAAYYVFYRLLSRFSDSTIPVDSGDFCLMDRRVVEILNAIPERTRFLRGIRSWVGFRQYALEYERPPRWKGHSGWTLARLVTFAADGLVSFSTAPLRMASIMGFLLFLFSVGYALWVLLNLAVWGIPVRGFAAMAILLTVIGGGQLLAIGIIGEYLGRVFNEVRQRPIYLINEVCGLQPPTITRARRRRTR